MTPAKGYTEMKDSGIEWIPQIPTDWQVKRLKELFSFGKGLPITKADLVDSGVAVISYGQIHAKSNTGTHLAKSLLRYVPKTFLETNPSAILRKGDIVLADTSEDLDGLGNAALMDIDDTVFAGYHTIILHPGNADFSKYLSYLFRTDNWRSQLRANASGIKVFSVTQKMLRSCNLILPPKAVRDAITAYLDTQCAKIDEIIAQAKASIEDYKQWKASIIYEAVTKGLDPNVEMKDSGIEFVGRIPGAWKIKKLGNIGKLQNGISKSSEYFGFGFPFVSYGDVYRNLSLPTNPSGLINSTDDERERYSVQEGDIFFTRTSETIEEVGLSCVCEKTIPNATFAGFLIRVRPFTDEVITGFTKYFFRSPHLRDYFAKEMNLVTRASLSQGLLKNVPVVIPPVHEQEKIVSFLDQKCQIVDFLISEKQSLIDDLESYKKSLIYEVVTGKRRVC